MKTTNIAQKTGSSLFKTFAVVVSLVFIGMSTNVNGFWSPLLVDNAMDKTKLVAINQETDALQTIAFLTPASHSMEATGTTNAFYIEPARDKSLEIESWMTNETYFGSAIQTDRISEEESLEIESWMLENPYFAEPVVISEDEPALEVEAWMTDESIWEN